MIATPKEEKVVVRSLAVVRNKGQFVRLYLDNGVLEIHVDEVRANRVGLVICVSAPLHFTGIV